MGDVSFNFAKLQLKFHYFGKEHIWQGIKDSNRMVNGKSISKESINYKRKTTTTALFKRDSSGVSQQ